jgi:hypothetical protein
MANRGNTQKAATNQTAISQRTWERSDCGFAVETEMGRFIQKERLEFNIASAFYCESSK